MNAFFLCAGLGTRMKELTANLPKPLLKIQGIRLLDYSLYFAWKMGCKKGILNTHYLAEKIHSHIQNFHGFPIFISHEEGKIRGTGGGISYALQRYPEFLQEELWVFNPDTILQPNSLSFLDEFMPQGSLCHLYLLPNPTRKYTSLYLNPNHTIQFEPNETQPYYYIGFSRMKPDYLQHIAQDPRESWELTESWKEFASQGKITGSRFPGMAWDVGTKEEWIQFESKKVSILSEEEKKELESLFD